MSGTSLDGVDAVLADLSSSPRLIASCHEPFPKALRDRLLALNSPGNDELERSAVAANELSRLYAEAISKLLGDSAVAASRIAAIGCHGQTVRHNPGNGYTIQLVNGALLAELTGIAVVCDFRSRDIAAGGQGAPLVPAFHRAVFSSSHAERVIVNIGGISNLTRLACDGAVYGFDCGPGNVLMDAWVSAMRGASYDENGAWAAQGRVIPELLEKLLAHPFFSLTPPKSTGRDAFNLVWLRGMLTGSETPADVQATLLELTAQGISRAVQSHCPAAEEIYVCGGGARNVALMKRLEALIPGKPVRATDGIGIDAEWVEALAFAWLAQRTIKSEAGNVPDVTGARGLRVLGAIYPT